MTTLQTYLWLKLDSVSLAFALIGTFGVMLTISGTIIHCCETGEKPYGLMLLILFIPMFIIGLMMPDSKEYAVMYILPKITNEETLNIVKTESLDMYKMAKEYLVNKVKESE